MKDTAKTTSTALLIGLGGATGAALVGLPAAGLIGSSVAVACAATLGLRLTMPQRLRDVAFGIIGISLGAGVQADALAQVGSWSVSLFLLTLSLVATLLIGAALLRRGFDMDAETAFLASSPGTMSNAIAIALDGHGNVTTITILQVMRLLVLVAVVPPLATALDADTGGIVYPAAMNAAALILLLVATLCIGLPAARFKVPAACLLVGMILSAVAHVADLAHGPAPSWAIFAAFVVTGTAVGTRLTSISPRALLALGRPGAALIATNLAVSLAFASVAALVTGLSWGQIWIAYAPGGVEAMAAIGLALGYDPAFVAIHHFARIVVLVVLVPLLLRRNA
jgi:hypothetical protein